jgi:hypothetical protein
MKIFKDKKLKEPITLNNDSKKLYQRELVQRSRDEIKLKMSKILSNRKHGEFDGLLSPKGPPKHETSVSKTIESSRIEKSPEFLIKSNQFTFKGLKRNVYSFKSNYYAEGEKSRVRGSNGDISYNAPQRTVKQVDLQIIKHVSIPSM